VCLDLDFPLFFLSSITKVGVFPCLQGIMPIP
jgi:hypothetical protein